MKFCISPIHLGRYRIDMLDDDNKIISGTDGSSAIVMVMLTKWLFEPEARQYKVDERANSDALAEATIDGMKSNPSKYLPPKALPHG